jgi:hypothetical protein
VVKKHFAIGIAELLFELRHGAPCNFVTFSLTKDQGYRASARLKRRVQVSSHELVICRIHLSRKRVSCRRRKRLSNGAKEDFIRGLQRLWIGRFSVTWKLDSHVIMDDDGEESDPA